MIHLDPDELSALRLSLAAGAWSCALALLPGIALGVLLARATFRGKLLVDVLVHLPLVLPPVSVGYLLLVLLGRNRSLGAFLHERLGLDLAFTFRGVALAAAVMGLPLLVRSVRLAVELVDPGFEQAAAVLGAGPWRRLVTITLPLALPGVVAGVLLCFARSLGEFGATMTFAGNRIGETTTLPLAIFTATQVPGGDERAWRLTGVSLLLSLVALAASELVARRLRRRIVAPLT